MEEEEDPVIQEIPVFLSQALAKNLFIYQYPAKPGNKDWTETKVLNAAVKPKNHMVKIEFGLDTYSDKYCESKGEQIAINTDGQSDSRFLKDKEKEKSQYFKNGVMDKIVYENGNPCTESGRYAVAILQDKEIHCTPVEGIVQLRPSFNYFDKQDKRAKDLDKEDVSEDEEEEPQPQQVMVKFASRETEVAKKAKEKSFEFLSSKEAEEPWYTSKFWHSDTDQADLERLKLFSPNQMQGPLLSLNSSDYIRSLVPKPPDDEADEADKHSRRSVWDLPLVDQCRKLLADAKLLRFSDIRSLVRVEGAVAGAAGGGVEAALLSALSGAACCVRGLWTARSADLYAQPSSASGAPPRLMCAARDYLLYLFTQASYVDRRKVAAAVRLPPEEVLDILQSVAKLNPNTGWELLLPPDTAFEAKYPDVIQRQNLYWEAKQRHFNEMLLGDGALPKRQRKKSQRDSFSSDTMMSPKPRCNSTSSVHEDLDSDRKRPRNKSLSGTGKRTRNVSVGSLNDGSAT